MSDSVFYNHGTLPVFIVTKWRPDPLSGPAIQERTICVAPGEGIDLSSIDFSREKPKDRILYSVKANRYQSKLRALGFNFDPFIKKWTKRMTKEEVEKCPWELTEVKFNSIKTKGKK